MLGIDFDGDITESKEIPPYSHGGGIPKGPNSDGKFYHSGLYLKVALQFDQNNQNLYESYDVNTQVGNQNFKWSTNRRWNIAYPDPKNVYSYRMYTERHIVKAEYLGIKTTTNEFNGVFVNTTNEDAKGNVASQGQNVLLQFMKNNVNYQVTLEPGIFNILNSDANVPNSMRPKDDTEKRSLTFLTMDKRILAQIPLTPEAICNMLPDPKKEGAFIPGDPMLYTYEIFQGTKGISVGMQGLAVGHYKQTLDVNNPTKNVVRDINPLECHVWYQSPQDTQKMLDPKSTDVAFNPQEQVWISYVTKDSVVQKKINPGDVVDFTILRPQVSEKQALLFVVALQTNDDTKAQAFLKRLTDGIIGKDAITPKVQVSDFNASVVFTKIEANDKGVVDDTQGSGITGAVLVMDMFSPRGLGYGPYYYMIPSPLLRMDQLSNALSSFLDPKKIGVTDKKSGDDFQTKTLNPKIVTWITNYQKNKQGVKQEVTSYVQQYASSGFFEKDGKTLSSFGKHALAMVLTGPVSIENYPLIRQAGTNEFILLAGEKPKEWPGAKTSS